MSPSTVAAVVLTPSWTTPVADVVSCAVWSPDGQRLVVGSVRGDAAVVEQLAGARQDLGSHADGALCAAWSSDSRWLAIGGQQSSVCLWHQEAGSLRIPVRGWVNDLAWAPRSDRLAVAAGGDVVVVRPDTTVVADYPFLEGNVNALCWAGGGRYLVAATLGAVHWFDPAVSGRRPARTARVVGAALTLATTDDGTRVAGGMLNGSLSVWEAASGRGEVLTGYDGGVERLSWRHDGLQLAVAAHRELDVWSFDARGVLVGAPVTLAETDGTLPGLAFHPRRPLLASGGHEGRILIWQPGTAESPIAELDMGDEVTTLSWSPGGRALVVGTAGGQVRRVGFETSERPQ